MPIAVGKVMVELGKDILLAIKAILSSKKLLNIIVPKDGEADPWSGDASFSGLTRFVLGGV